MKFAIRPMAFLMIAVGVANTPSAAQADDNMALKQALHETLRENYELRSELEAARMELDRLRGLPALIPGTNTAAPSAQGMMTPAITPEMMLMQGLIPGTMASPSMPVLPMQSTGRTHTVSRGETLSGIAAKYYGDPGAFRKIFDANRKVLSDPNVITPGQVLTIP